MSGETSSSGSASPLLGARQSGTAYADTMNSPPASITSRYSETSAFLRRKEAAAGGIGRYESLRDGVNKDPGEEGADAGSESWLELPPGRRRGPQEHATTDLQTFTHLLKGNVGTGLLALPEAVKNAGLLVGVAGLLLMGLIASHCMLILVDVSQELCRRRQVPALNYAEVSSAAVSEHTNKPIIPVIAGYVTNAFLMITQFGFCCVYLVFVGDNVDQVMCRAFGIGLGSEAWIAVTVIFVTLLTWIRNLDELAIISSIANLCILFSLAVIIYEVIYQLVVQHPSDKSERAAIRDGDIDYYYRADISLALYFGAAIYSFEGIGVVLPLENKMKKPEHSKKVVILAMLVTTIMYASFGGLGYITYGGKIKGSITLNLLSHRIGACSLFLIVKLYYSFAILASYAVQFYVPMDFLEPPLFKKLRLDKLMYWYPRHHGKIRTLVQLSFRTIVVLITAMLALAIPDLDDLISLVGAFASSALALVFPPLLEMLVFWNSPNRKCCGLPRPFWITKDILIMTLGIVGFVIGTFASLQNIVENFDFNYSSSGSCGLGNCH